MIEAESDILNLFHEIESIAPGAGEYLELFVDAFQGYETPEFKTKPELVMQCFPNGLDEDINELLFLLSQSGEIEGIRDFLLRLRSALEGSPVVQFLLTPVFEEHQIFAENQNVKACPLEEKIKKKDRYKVTNIMMGIPRLKEFFRACDLEITGKGKGDHRKLKDRNGNSVGGFSDSLTKKTWLKHVIKMLLTKGVPMADIVTACKKLKIDFKVINS